jgi:hypothetical protein
MLLSRKLSNCDTDYRKMRLLEDSFLKKELDAALELCDYCSSVTLCRRLFLLPKILFLRNYLN